MGFNSLVTYTAWVGMPSPLWYVLQNGPKPSTPPLTARIATTGKRVRSRLQTQLLRI